MICVQKVLLHCHSMQPPPHACTHAHTHFPASPASLTGSWFCKAAFCFVSCFPAFAHVSLTDAISLFCRQGALLPLKVALLFIPLHHPHHHRQCPESSLPFHCKGQTLVYTIARLLILMHNDVLYAFPIETYFAAAFVLQTPAKSVLICLVSSPCLVSHCQGLCLCLLPAAFVFSFHKGTGR